MWELDGGGGGVIGISPRASKWLETALSFTHPHVILKVYDFPSVEHNRRYFEKCLNISQWGSVLF